MAERIGARNGTGGAVLREIMRLDTHFWARRQGVGGSQKTVLLYNASCLLAFFLSRQRSMETEGLKGCLLTRHFFLKSTHTLRAQNVYPNALSPVILLRRCHFSRPYWYAQPRLGAPPPVARLSIGLVTDA